MNILLMAEGSSPLERMGTAKAKTELYDRRRELGKELGKVAIAEFLTRAYEALNAKLQNPLPAKDRFSEPIHVGGVAGYVAQLEKLLPRLAGEGKLIYHTNAPERGNQGYYLKHAEGKIQIKDDEVDEELDLRILRDYLTDEEWEKLIN